MSVDLSSFTQTLADGGFEVVFALDHVACGACAAKIEKGLRTMPGLDSARVNLTDKRLIARWHNDAFDPSQIPERLRDLGYDGQPFQPTMVVSHGPDNTKYLIRYLAVAFFGAMNIMLLSISVWSGNASGISPETRDLFHWISALIALPVAAYAGQPFYRSAWRVLRAGHVNMDVPITLGVSLALFLSIYETAHSARHAYFDSAVMLLLFLLAGRTLDTMMRAKASTLTANLLALRGQSAQLMTANGGLVEVPVSSLNQHDRIWIAQGERFGADGIVETGTSEIDQSLVTGETTPVTIAEGDRVYAGALNLGAPITIRVERGGGHDLIDEIEQLRNNAMAVKDRRIVLADRAASYYAPFVHSAAALTFLGWFLATGSGHVATVIAISVLIITCPCALGLAIPAVHVAASSALMRRGVLLQEGDALERIAECDIAVFDKTGTLTLPEMTLSNANAIEPDLLQQARRLACSSRHPVAMALAKGGRGLAPIAQSKEIPGQGICAMIDRNEARLGNPAFSGTEDLAAKALAGSPGATALGFSHGDRKCLILFVQQVRKDAIAKIGRLKEQGLEIAIFSGDNEQAVADVARTLSVTNWQAAMTPAAKIAALKMLAAKGHKILMIGDGINDAPALAGAHASMAPANASQITQASADALFLGEHLEPVCDTLAKARQSRRLMNQNLWFAALYNLIAIPLAVAGLVTPLIAAAAMSISSIIVSLNAIRAADLSVLENATPAGGGTVAAYPPQLQPELSEGRTT